MGRVRLCRNTPLFVSLLLLFLSLLPAPPTPSSPSRLSLFLSNHLIQTSRTLHTKKKRNADELADNTTYFSSGDKTAVPAAPNPRPPFISEKPFPLIPCLRQLLFLHPLHASATPPSSARLFFFCFFFPPPFPCFAFSLRAKTRAFSHERSFPFPGTHARTLSSQMGQCARKATGRAHHCARARVLFANGEGSGRERWESVSFFFFPTCFTTQSCSLIFLTVTRLFTAHF
jgi:hypothetical protein